MPRGAPFPKDVADFDSDERVSFSRLDGKYILVDDDGEEWEYSEATGKWFQPASEEQIAAYQQAYGGPQPAEPEPALASAQDRKKRKAPPAADADNKKPRVQENRAIYITNLPPDATIKEIDDEFSKYGMIEQAVDGSKRIKMYTDDKGRFTGEALVVYFKKDSVAMAIRMMDDSWFRPGKGEHIRVQEAERTYKKVQDGEEVKKGLTRQERKNAALNRAEMNRKLAEWSDEEDEAAKETFAAPTNKWAKIVIIKHAFTLQEIEEDPDARADIREDFQTEGEKFGKVTNVVVYDQEPDGIVTIKFDDAEAAAQFIKACHDRFFGGTKLDVRAAQDNPKGKFKKSARYLDEEEEEELLDSLIQK